MPSGSTIGSVEGPIDGHRRTVTRQSLAKMPLTVLSFENLPKEEVVERREIGLTDAARRAGHVAAAIYEASISPPVAWAEISDHVSIAATARSWRLIRKTRPWPAPLNPGELNYRRLWAAGVPFLKRRLLHTNHYGLDLNLVHADLERLSPEWHALTTAHGRRTGEHGLFDQPSGR